ncbi:hypothetical protein [Dyella jiangningensis]
MFEVLDTLERCCVVLAVGWDWFAASCAMAEPAAMQNTTAIAMERWFRFIISIPEVAMFWLCRGRRQTVVGMEVIARQKYLSESRKKTRNLLLNLAISCHLT